MLAWWLQRHQDAQESPAKLERVTYHVAPKWIEAVRREADVTGESYAAVVNRAFAQYFAGEVHLGYLQVDVGEGGQSRDPAR